jgi:23S rRNA (uracil1939-C5)-methyltransferase
VVFHQIKVIDAGKRSISSEGPDGKVVFIPCGSGDVVDATLSARPIMGKAFIFMNSEHRIEPICEHFGVCGCCINMKYSQQLYYKQNEVLNHLQRIGRTS